MAEMTQVEQDASNDGWVPEEEFRANPHNEGKKWRTAEEFMDRKSLFDKIDEQHREIRKLRDGVSALQQHNQQIETLTKDKVLKELRAQKAEALKEGDMERVEEIRDKIDDVKAQPAPVPQQQTSQVPAEFATWKGENTWYDSNPEMRAFADAVGVAVHSQGKTPTEVLKEVSKKVKMAYPDAFRNPNKNSAPPVESSSRAPGKPSKGPELTEMQEKIWKDLQRAGVPSVKDPKQKMTREEYVDQLKALGE